MARLTLPSLLALAATTMGCGSSASSTSPPPRAAAASAEIAHPLKGKPLPEFRRRSITETDIDTKALGGRVTVIKFFAKYCEPCKWSLPAAQRLAGEHTDVAFIGIAEDESVADTLETVRAYQLTFPVVHDRGQVLGGRFRVRELPITFVVGKRGTVAAVLGPGGDEGELRSAIERARNDDVT
jgi:thiol-disulfide isomerase/thioredoxin